MTKRAFYDFSVSPYSFDFAVFLLTALSQDCNEVVLVPGQRLVKGPNGELVEFQKCTPEEQQFRLQHIILGLYPNAIVCKDREEARSLWHEGCFPYGYTVDAPVAAHTFGNIMKQNKILPFAARTDYVAQVRADGWTHPKMVAITIRDTHIKPGRNSNIAEWIKAADWMKQVGLEPVFIPDTEKPDESFGGHKSCAKAALDIQYRLAMYDLAYLNVGVNNGPMALNILSRRPTLYFRPITVGYKEAGEDFWKANGVPIRSQLPWFSVLQRIIWEGTDDAENIILNIQRWLKAREEGKDEWPLAVAPSYPIFGVVDHVGRGKQMAEALAAAKKYGWQQMKRRSHGTALMSIVCYGPSLKDTWRYIKRPIMTVSGAHDFLLERGIVPDYHTDCDPREHKQKMFKGPHQLVKYRMATCCHPSWWPRLEGHDVELWHLHNDSHTEEWVREHDPGANMLGGGSTAGMRALEVGSMLGYRRFEMHGMDGSFESNEVRHAGTHLGKVQNLIEVNCDGRWYKSSPQMIEASKEMVTFIQNYDCEITFHGDGLCQAMVKHFLSRFRVIDPSTYQKAA